VTPRNSTVVGGVAPFLRLRLPPPDTRVEEEVVLWFEVPLVWLRVLPTAFIVRSKVRVLYKVLCFIVLVVAVVCEYLTTVVVYSIYCSS